MPRRRRRKVTRHQPPGCWPRGTDIVITYKGLDLDRDAKIRKALGRYSTGSGMMLLGNARERDHTATIPDDHYDRVIAKLLLIPAVRVKKLVQKWVTVRRAS